ncbi:AfsR/SARP family transcriptional regulator [Streptomyces exfoliatus]|uniref:AfsR/SARP family transcriptional regulator n=1 Tax=Streptomyces exfoliatus TaxID=1905 RepID=UPI0004650BB9|nr:AfsR/SARP family transcriptional regulator [Streptomyces exfoliatus]
MRFNLIGPFQIVDGDGRILPTGSPKVSQVLAVLLAHSGDPVTPDTLIRELWQHNPPRSALNTVQTYVHHARRLLALPDTRPDTRPDAGPDAGRPVLSTHFGGYTMRVDDRAVDIKVFEQLVARGKEEFRAGRCEAAAGALGAALGLWRGPVLLDVPKGSVLAGRIVHLEEVRIRALELRIEALQLLGRLRELIPELRTLVHDYPFNEWFHGRLITALHQAGRRAEALDAYRSVRRLLRDELGLEPSPDIQRLHERILGPPRGPAQSATALGGVPATPAPARTPAGRPGRPG